MESPEWVHDPRQEHLALPTTGLPHLNTWRFPQHNTWRFPQQEHLALPATGLPQHQRAHTAVASVQSVPGLWLSFLVFASAVNVGSGRREMCVRWAGGGCLGRRGARCPRESSERGGWGGQLRCREAVRARVVERARRNATTRPPQGQESETRCAASSMIPSRAGRAGSAGDQDRERRGRSKGRLLHPRRGASSCFLSLSFFSFLLFCFWKARQGQGRGEEYG